MNFKTTLILIVLLVLVGGYIAFERSRGDTPPAPAPVAAHLLTAGYDEIRSLTITPANAAEISLSREGATWRLTAPFAARADGSAVGEVIAALTGAQSKGQPGAGAEAGFTPAVTVGVMGKTLAFSDRNSVGDSLVRVTDSAGTRWSLTDGAIVAALSKPASAFRDPSLVVASFGQIRKVALEYGASKVDVTREGDKWSVSDGKTTMPGDANAIGDLLQVITGLRAAEFPATAPIEPFSTTQLTVRLFEGGPGAGASGAPGAQGPLPATHATAEGASTTVAATQPTETVIRFGRFEDARKERVIVSAGDVVALVPVYSLNALKKSALDLRDKQVVQLKPEDVTAIDVVNESIASTRPDTAVSLTLVPGEIRPPATAPSAPRWEIAGVEKGEPADPQKVQALLDAVTSLSATKFLEGDAATQPTLPWLIRVRTASGMQDIRVGETAVRANGLIFEPATPLLPLLTTSFALPAAPRDERLSSEGSGMPGAVPGTAAAPAATSAASTLPSTLPTVAPATSPGGQP